MPDFDRPEIEGLRFRVSSDARELYLLEPRVIEDFGMLLTEVLKEQQRPAGARIDDDVIGLRSVNDRRRFGLEVAEPQVDRKRIGWRSAR